MNDSKYQHVADGTAYPAGMPAACVEALERARAGGWNVRIFFGDKETGRAWAEEHDVFGRVSRTMGSIKAAMLVEPRAHGGSPFMDCIVAVATGAGRFSYKHPGFDVGTWEVKPGTEGYAADVHHNGEVHSRHRSEEKAARFAAFMKGERFSK